MECAFFGDDAYVAYADTGAAWVAVGPPIGPPDALAAVASRFVERARGQGRRACFFSVDMSFCDEVGLHALGLGEEPRWDVPAFAESVRAHRGLHEQIRRSRAKGVVARTLKPEELAEGQSTRVAVEGLIAQWLASRRLAPMGFLVAVEPFTFPEERLYVVGERGGRLVSFLAAVPIYATRSFFIEDLLRTREAPNGTAELMLEHAFRVLASRGIEMVTLGLAPLSGDNVSPILKGISSLTRRLYSFQGVREFKARMHPSHWHPQWLGFPRRSLGALAIWDSLSAFAPGGFLRFGAQTLFRARRAGALPMTTQEQPPKKKGPIGPRR
jgi:phosphatidylglycerol lysyltransferase